MISSGHKIRLVGSSVLAMFVATAAYFSEPLFLLLPVLITVAILFVQYPLALFYTLLFSIPWSMEFNFTESLGTDLPDEPLMLLLAFACLVLWLTKSGRPSEKKKLHPLLWLLFFTMAWLVITVIFSTNISISVKYLLAKGWYLLAFVGAPLLLHGDEKLLKTSALVLFLSMFLVTCTGLVKHATMGFTFASINYALYPFFRNHVNYSALLVFMVPLQLAFYSFAQNKKLRYLICISLAIVLAALYLSYARGAWLALLAGLIAYVLVKKGWLLRSYVCILFVLAGLVFWLQQNNRYLFFAPKHDITVFHENFTEHIVATYKGNDVSTAERFYRWVAGANMSTGRLATGFGPTTFYEQYRSYTVPAFRTWVSNNPERSTVHNYFLLLLVEQGLMGLCFFLVLLGGMFWYAQKIYQRTSSRFWKVTASTIAAILAMQCTLNFLSDLIETDKVGSVFYLCLSFLIIADAKTESKEERQKTVATGSSINDK